MTGSDATPDSREQTTCHEAEHGGIAAGRSWDTDLIPPPSLAIIRPLRAILAGIYHGKRWVCRHG